MNNKKLTIKTTKHPAVTINRNAIVTDRLVYIAVANKKFHYPNGDSQIVYIGTTKAGAIRIARGNRGQTLKFPRRAGEVGEIWDRP